MNRRPISHYPNVGPMISFLAMFRLRARIPAVLLLMAILAPVLVTVMTSPAVSAEQQLLADIATSFCDQNGQHQKPGDHNQPAHHECCILCASPAHVLAAVQASTLTASPLDRSKHPEQQIALQNILMRAPPLEWASPRGPPAHLPA